MTYSVWDLLFWRTLTSLHNFSHDGDSLGCCIMNQCIPYRYKHTLIPPPVPYLWKQLLNFTKLNAVVKNKNFIPTDFSVLPKYILSPWGLSHTPINYSDKQATTFFNTRRQEGKAKDEILSLSICSI